MKHIRNSVKSVFILEHDTTPVNVVTDFGENIISGSLCIDKSNAELFICEGTTWKKIASFTEGDEFIPLSGTEPNKPLNGNIEMLNNVSFISGISKLTFSNDSIIFTINDNDTNSLVNLNFKFDRNSIRYKDNSVLDISSNSKDNFVHHTEQSLSLLANSYSNSLFGYNKNVTIVSSGANISSAILQNVNFTNTISNSINGSYIDTTFENVYRNLMISTNTGTNIYDNINQNIFSVYTDNTDITDLYRNIIFGEYYSSNIISCSDNIIHIMNTAENNSVSISDINGSEIRIKYIDGDKSELSNIYSSKILAYDFTSHINNVFSSNIIGDLKESYITDSKNVDLLGEYSNVNITASDLFMRGEFSNMYINGTNNVIIGTNSNTSGIIGNNNILFNSTISGTNSIYNSTIFNSTITHSTYNSTIINSHNINDTGIDNVFINCDNLSVNTTSSVYFPKSICLTNSNNIDKITASDSTSSRIWTMPSNSGIIALQNELGFVLNTWEEQLSDNILSRGVIFRGGKFSISLELNMLSEASNETIDLFYNMTQGYVSFDRFSDVVIDKPNSGDLKGNWVVDKFYDAITAYTFSESNIGQLVGEAYLFDIASDDNGISKTGSNRLASIADTISFTLNHSLSTTANNTKRIISFEGSIYGL